MKKIIIYNWDRVDGKIGAGVSVYIRNLISGLIENGNYKIIFLNSGLTYTADKEIKIVQVNNTFDDRIDTYEIVNSPVIAPIQQSDKNIKEYLTDNILPKIISTFIREINPDIIHFNNIEGLSLGVLHLKKEYPEIKFIYSVHNYFPLCSRVNLWKDEKIGKGHNCDKKDYSECSNCYKKSSYLGTKMIRSGNKILGYSLKALDRFSIKRVDVSLYEHYQKDTIAAINNNCDAVLAVSNRVKELLLNAGVKNDIIHTSYIGTAVAEQSLRRPCVNDVFSSPFVIAYMGYMREDKGFYFFLDMLEKMSLDISKNIKVKIIARYAGKKEEVSRIHALENKFYKIEIYDGYTKDNQKELLKDVHLGIVPVLWEDNLPQVAIEQIAFGIPILVSNLGGAKELCQNDDFVFKAKDTEEFMFKLRHIYENRDLLIDFFKTSKELVTMSAHIRDIENYYDKE